MTALWILLGTAGWVLLYAFAVALCSRSPWAEQPWEAPPSHVRRVRDDEKDAA